MDPLRDIISPMQRRFTVHSATALLLLASGYVPLLYRFAREQWAQPQYAFFPLVVAAAFLFAWQRLGTTRSAPPERSWPALVSAAVVLLMLVLASVLWSGRMAAISAWLGLALLLWHIGGWSWLRAWLPSAILLALVIGPPMSLDEVVLIRLRSLAVGIGARLLEWLAVPHQATGTVIVIPDGRLMVADACSGINSLMACVVFTLTWCFWRNRPLWRTATLTLAVVPLALWVNVIRIVAGVWLKVQHNTDILSGNVHEQASLVLFAACMVVVLSTDHLLGILAHRSLETEDADPTATPQGVPKVTDRPPFQVTPAVWAISILFALTGLTQLVYASTHGGLRVWMGNASECHLRTDAIIEPPERVDNWQRARDIEARLQPPEIVGKTSRIWAYRCADLTAVLAMDYPFAGYHDLTVCYRNAGWSMADAAVLTQPDSGPIVQASFSRTCEWGSLTYCLLSENGHWLSPPATEVTDKLANRLGHIGRPDWNACAYQIQVWTNLYQPIAPEQRAQYAQLLLGARKPLAKQILDQLEGHR